MLRRPDTPYVLTLDGLDENSFFANLQGLQQLTNQLAELECDILLTTRTEHANDMFGSFNSAFDHLTTKYGSKRDARWLELGKWHIEQVLELVDHVATVISEREQKRLLELKGLLTNGSFRTFYHDLPLHPLFLQFLLDDVIEHGVRKTGKTSLIERWIKMKIRRDRKLATRISPDPSIDTEEFVSRIIKVMEEVAFKMTKEEGKSITLVETINESEILLIANRVFNTKSTSVLSVLLNSFLIPFNVRGMEPYKIGFVLRVFQEYFLAAFLVRTGGNASLYPASIQELSAQLINEKKMLKHRTA